ncbi:uncharacterized protein EV420DRAFT_539617 [Desarmillaria tabescens]|uniref:BHLH domain-containing protein n=2 Tax=Physalacriaceae TaxID=862241 RepID=A0AA39N3Z6_ARMTA|nr:uncharacterized protein EV420DRAFT_539617 [Desarmillaria tabescens]KAK0457097.1 hypothetical protein EV420DRAFT_539617 [Desarmillaria tabescens]
MAPNAATQEPAQPAAQAAPAAQPAVDVPTIPGIGRDQLLALLTTLDLPVFKNANPQGTKVDAAQALSNLAQQSGFNPAFSINDPGPSSHPGGPPNLGPQKKAEGEAPAPQPEEPPSTIPQGPNPNLGARRSKSGAAMGSDEWTRQRKDNHKEVERRRRGNINEGINELGRIVPNGSGEKAKGAILSRAVQYIHHLKENEARNIEKWTLEKLLMDQAMGDLQAQLEEMRRMWDEERMGRQRAEAELEGLKGGAGKKRASEDEGGKEEGDGKRQRTE